MSVFKFVFLGLFFATSAFAYSTPPGFDSAKWNQLVATMLQKGKPIPSAEGYWRSLSRVVPDDTTQPRKANYISALGHFDNAGNFVPDMIYAVSENWTLQNGNWDIDQWIFTVAVTGELEQSEHFHMVETTTGHVLNDDSLPVGEPTDAAELARWAQVLAPWYSGSY